MNAIDRDKVLARFWPKVNKAGPIHPTLGTACWLWTSEKNTQGYGRMYEGRRRRLPAHRVAYELLTGPIPTGLQLDHLCRVRACVNPAHLEPVTQRENTLRGETLPAAQVKRTHCPQGHPYSGDNLATQKRGRGRTSRQCLTCRRHQGEEYRRAVRLRRLPVDPPVENLDS